MCQLGSKGQPPVIVTSWGLGATHEEIVRLSEGGFVGRARSGQRAALEPLYPLLDPILVHATNPPLTHAAAAAIRLPAGVDGCLLAGFVTPPRDRTLALWTIESYAAVIGLCLHNPDTLPGLLGATHRDGLTGCLTYDGIRHELDREINRSDRGGLSLSVCFIDLDGFKRVNDIHGHLRGNQVLAEVAEILREGVRACDTVGRYGGDEFIAILPQTDECSALALAQRLRAQLACTRLRSSNQSLTASIGIAEWSPGTTSEQVLAAADSALLAAKAQRSGTIVPGRTRGARVLSGRS